MNITTWKVGDWCFYDYQLAVVESVDEDAVTGVSNGYCHTGGRDLRNRCFPLSKEVLRISGEAERWSKVLHRLTASLNYPDIHRELVSIWATGCSQLAEPDNEKRTYDALRTFCQSIVDSVEAAQAVSVGGVRIFR